MSCQRRSWTPCRWRRPPSTSPRGSPELPSGSAVYVAELARRIVGYAYVLPSPDDSIPAGTSELGSLYVTEDVAGTGVAHYLMDAAIEQAHAFGQGVLTLWVRRENGRARRFYEKEGMRPDGAERTRRTTSCRSRCTRSATECRSNRSAPGRGLDDPLQPIEPRTDVRPTVTCRFKDAMSSAPKRHLNESPAPARNGAGLVRKCVNERGSNPRHVQNSPSLTDLELPSSFGVRVTRVLALEDLCWATAVFPRRPHAKQSVRS
jgi:GNAT superfamily N-acetyltransferase